MYYYKVDLLHQGILRHLCQLEVEGKALSASVSSSLLLIESGFEISVARVKLFVRKDRNETHYPNRERNENAQS